MESDRTVANLCLDPEVCNWPSGRCVEPSRCKASTAAKVCRWPRKHVWRVVDKIEQAAPIEVVQKAGVRKLEGSYDSWERMGTKPVVVTRRCERCGLEEVRRV